MRNYLLLGCVAALFCAWGLTMDAQAAPERKRIIREIQCPDVIANKISGTFQKRSKRTSAFPFSCFVKTQDAKRAGFKIDNVLTANNALTGWYRMAVKLKKDTCSNRQPDGGITTIFLQVKANDSGVFGEVCPGEFQYVGQRVRDGFVMSARYNASRPIPDPLVPTPAACLPGDDQATTVVEFGNINKNKVGRVVYKQVYRCRPRLIQGTLQSVEANSCTTEYQGVAFRETAPQWLPVPDNVNNFHATCGSTLSTQCSECHG